MGLNRKLQVSMEYLIVVGFITFVVIAVLGIAFFYSGTIKSKIRETQINNFANKIISTSESVFYAGKPSKATITTFLPDNVRAIQFSNQDIFITYQSSSGLNVIAFSSNVPILNSTSVNINEGLKKFELTAEEGAVYLRQV